MIRFIILFLLSSLVFAATPTWELLPQESNLTFTAIQNDAPVTGKFTKFSADLHGDLNQLQASSIKIIVDLNSVTDPSDQLAETLKTSEWFNTKVFPDAIFQSTEITKTSEKTYQAKGTLKIRDKTLPITINFIQEEYSPTKARVKGSATIKRTAFDVGQGEWADTNAIKDEVRVDFILTAVKK